MATGNGRPVLFDHNGQPLQSRDPDGQRWQPGPDSHLAVPHVVQFAALLGSAWKTYLHGRHDDAITDAQSNAWAMERDLQIASLMQERQLAVSNLRWHIEVENERDPAQKALKDGLTQIVKAIPGLHRLRKYLLDGIWYGRQGAQLTWGWRRRELPTVPAKGSKPGPSDTESRRVLTVSMHQPVHGDSIGYHWDGTPYILINPQQAMRLGKAGQSEALTDGWSKSPIPEPQTGRAAVGLSTVGGRALFLQGSWRTKFILHQHELKSADFFRPVRAVCIYGVGVRSFVYWTWWLKTEWLGQISDWVQRTGLGVRLWYYQGGNPASKSAVQKAATEQSDKVNILIPRFGENPAEGLDFVETAGTGADMLLRLLEHLEEFIERFIVGQSMSGGSDNEDGLGGTGRANLAADTKSRITRYDAQNEDDSLTQDLVNVIKAFTYPDHAEIPARFVTDVDVPDAKETLDAAKTFCDLGGTIKEDQVRGAIGFDAPQEGDKVLRGQQPPGAAGMPGMPGGMPDGGQGDAALDDPGDDDSGAAASPDAALDEMVDQGVGTGHDVQPKRAARPGSPSRFAADHELRTKIKDAADATHTAPSLAQRRAGNYPKGRFVLHGLPITIETPRGAWRQGVSDDGTTWRTKAAHHYGYIRLTESEADGDHIDLFIGPDPESELVFVVDQVRPDGTFDEHKCLLGFMTEGDAVAGYLANYSHGWAGLGAITPMTLPAFLEWLEEGPTYRGVARYAKDKGGREHKESGPGGGQFTGGIVDRIHGAAHAMEGAAGRAVDTLPKPIADALKATGSATKSTLAAAYVTYTKANAAAQGVAGKRGMDAAAVQRLSATLFAADALLGGKLLGGAVGGVVGAAAGPAAGIAAGYAASMVPVASLSYIAGAKVLDAARAAVRRVMRKRP